MLKPLLNYWSRPSTPSKSAVSKAEFLIDMHQVVKNYATPAGEFTALRGIDLQVSPGEFVAVIGKSGSGKSTLINMVTGIDQPTKGEVRIAGTLIQQLNRRQMAKWRGNNVGIIFQFFQLLPTLSLIENIMLPMEFCGLYTLPDRRERALHLLELVGMVDQADKLPAMVSGGQQQRAAIARALANDPQILVADEPTGSLDSKTADNIFRLFETFVSQGKTMLMVTHDRDLAGRVSRVVYIADGEITGQQVATALPSLSKEDLVEVYSKLEPIKYNPGEVIVAQGDVARHMYIISRGDLEVVLNHGTPQETVVNQLGKGQFFGEIGLMEGGRRTATIRVAQNSDAVVMQLDRQTFIDLLDRSDLTKEHIIQLMRVRTEHTAMGALGLGQEQSSEFAANFERVNFEPGATIIKQGDLADKFYVITQGEVEIINEHPDGSEIRINRLGYAQYFGEMGLLRGGRRTATVRATEHGAEVAYINQERFRQLMDHPDIRKDDIMTLLQQRALGISMGVLGFDASTLKNVTIDFESVVYRPGEMIVRQDEATDKFYVITQGDVDVIHYYPDGREEIINHLYSGQYFGKIALHHQKNSSTTVRAGLSQVELLVMEQEVFHKLRRDYLSRQLDEYMPDLRRRGREDPVLNQIDLSS